MDLIRAWADFNPTAGPPYVLDADRAVLKKLLRRRDAWVNHTTWEDAYSHPDAGNPDDNSLHFGRLPTPFVGDMQRASIYILTLNPGHALSEYYPEYKIPSFRQALLDNLRQTNRDSSVPFILDPQFAYDGGFNYWHDKLKSVILELARYREVSFARARSELGSKLAVIELFPYHSVRFDAGSDLLDNLPSSQLAREFVRNHVLEKVRRGKAIVIAVRQVKRWNEALDDSVSEQHGIVRYTPGEARGANLSLNSRGGKAILKHLKRSLNV